MAKRPYGTSQKPAEAWWLLVKPRLKRLLNDAKYRATRDGVEFSLKFEDLRIPEYCPALGIPIRWDRHSPHGNKPSLDRVDSTRGYTRDNVRVISLRANMLKRDASLAEIAGLYRYMEAENG